MYLLQSLQLQIIIIITHHDQGHELWRKYKDDHGKLTTCYVNHVSKAYYYKQHVNHSSYVPFSSINTISNHGCRIPDNWFDRNVASALANVD